MLTFLGFVKPVMSICIAKSGWSSGLITFDLASYSFRVHVMSISIAISGCSSVFTTLDLASYSFHVHVIRLQCQIDVSGALALLILAILSDTDIMFLHTVQRAIMLLNPTSGNHVIIQ